MKRFVYISIFAMLLLIGSLLYMSVVNRRVALDRIKEDVSARCISVAAEINSSLQYSQSIQALSSNDYNVRKLSKLSKLSDVPGVIPQIEHSYRRLTLLRNSSPLIENASLCLPSINRTVSSKREFLRGISEKHKQVINTYALNPLQNVVINDNKLFFVQPLNTIGDGVSDSIVMEISAERVLAMFQQVVPGDDIWFGLINGGQVIASAGESPFKAEYGVPETFERMFESTSFKRLRISNGVYSVFVSPVSTMNASIYVVIPESYFVVGNEA